MNNENTEITEVAEVVAAGPMPIEDILSKLSFDSPVLKTTKAALEKTQARVIELQQQIAAAEKETETTRTNAEKMVKALRKSKLSDDAIMAALTQQFGQKRTVPTGADRQNHSVSDDQQIAVLDFIQNNPGCSKSSLRSAFPEVDKQGLDICVKRYIDQGKIRRDGVTRNATYTIV